MNKEEGEGKEKRREEDQTTNQGQMPPPDPAPASPDHQRLKKNDAGKGEIMDSLTATYWG